MSGLSVRERGAAAMICAIVGLSSAIGVAGSALAEAPQTEAQSAILLDEDSGQVLFQKSPDEQLAPASITKVMTMLLAMEDVDNGRIKMTDRVTASPQAVEMGGSQIYLKEGEVMSVGDLIKAIAVVSANDACVAIAEYISGTEQDFVNRMNKRAKALGMKHTHFVNTNGLPAAGHYSSARDIAIMSRELLKHPRILDDTRIWLDSLRDGKFTLRNTNELVKRYPGADGLKTGWTDEAGFCLSGTALRDGMRLVAVVMKTKSNNARFQETAKLLDYGFRSFEKRAFTSKGQVRGEVKVRKGRKETMPLVTAAAFRILVPKGNDVKVRLVSQVDERVEAPVKKGQAVGRLVAFQGQKQLGYVPLLASEADPKANFMVLFFRGIRDLFGSLLTFGRR